MSVEWPLQVALFQLLSADVTLAGLSVEVHDVPPEGENEDVTVAYPYVAVGALVANEWDTASGTGFDVIARLHSRSDTGSFKECRAIQARLYDLLHRQPLVVAGFNLTSLKRESSFCERESGRIIHGVCEFRALLEKT